MADFKRSLAVAIGINEYQDYPKLQTARYDAQRLAEILVEEQKYDYVILVTDDTYKEYRQGQELPVKNKYQPTLDGLRNLLDKRLPAEINPTKEDRLLFYFAGHGIPDDSDEGPKGYLVPLDADSKKRDSLLPMQELYKRLAALNCRHFLIVLDCCFAGRFSWSSTRKGRTFPKVIHQEHYDRFINSPAWQAITSASHDQEAFDILGDDNRGTVEGTNHSPFAEGLFKALRGEADVIPAGKNGQPARDGVITATELYLYLRDYVEIGSKERQTPGLWFLPKHDRGEYIFLVPGAELKLKPAPPVNEKNNPYRGLESFDEEHSRLFFGREELIEQLFEQISTPKQPLTVVLGVSGSGKSSLVKAGLIPCLRKLSQSEVFEVNLVSAYILTSAIVQAFPLVSPKFLPINYVHQWRILNPIRPGESPFTALAKTILALADVTGSNQPDTLNFLNVSTHLDNLTFITEILKQKVENLDEQVAESSHNNGEESSETLRLKKELEQFISMAKGWNQSTQKAKQLVIVKHFEELYALCRNQREQQQLQQAVSDCLNPLSQRLQSDPNQLIDIVTAWSQKNPGVRLLLTIDQFEELITLSQGKQKDKGNKQQQQKKLSNQPTQAVQQGNKLEEWQQFLNLLEKTLSANLEQLRIIVTLRSDFEPRLLNLDALKSYWTKARFPVRAMRSDELRQAIERPASEMALYFEPPNLVDKLIDEVGQMPGALPLLSFTLSELYIKLAQKWRLQETSDRALVLDADFDKQGGVAGSLTRRANEEYDNLPDDAHRATLRRVMLRMVTTEGGESARRRVPESELVYADAAENERVKLVLERFDRARLIVSGQETGEPYVEPAHDFLVRSWDKLQTWQQEEQEDLPLQRRLTPAAIEWKSKKQSSSLLGKSEPFLDWCDKRIDSVEDCLNRIKKDDQQSQQEKKRQFLWNGNPYLDVLKKKLKSYDHWFNKVEAEFVQQSVWRRRRNVNLRWGIAVGVTALSVSLTLWALSNLRQALIEKMIADKNSTQIQLRTNQLTLDALISSLREVKPLNNWLFWEPFQPNKQLQSQVIGTLRIASYAVREQNRRQLPQNWIVQDIVSQDKKILVAVTNDKNEKNSNNNVCILDTKIQPQKPLFCHNFFGNQGSLKEVKFSPDGKKIMIITRSSSQDNVYCWDLEYNQVYKLPEQSFSIVSFSPDSRKLAFTKDNSVYLWNWKARQLDRIFEMRIVMLQSLKARQLYPSETERLTDGIKGINFKPDGSLLVATATTRHDSEGRNFTNIEVLDVSSHKTYKYKSPRSYEEKSLGDFIISSNGRQLAATSYNLTRHRIKPITTLLWKSQNEEPQELSLDLGQRERVSFSPNGEQTVITSSDGTIRLVNSGSSKEQLVIQAHQGFFRKVSFTPDGKQLLTAHENGTISQWNLEQKLISARTPALELPGLFDTFALSPDGQQLVTLKAGSIQLWDLSSNQELKLPSLLQQKRYDKDSKLILSPNGKQSAQLVILGQNIIHLWDLSLGKEQVYETSFSGYTLNGQFGIFSPDGKQLAIAEDNSIQQLNLMNRESKKFGCEHEGQIVALTWKTDGKLVAATLGTRSGTTNLDIWDLSSDPSCQKQLASLHPDDDLIESLRYDSTFGPNNAGFRFNTDGNLVNILFENHIILWDWQSNLLVKLDVNEKKDEIDEAPNKNSYRDKISPDGNTLVTLDPIEKGYKIKLWKLGGLDTVMQRNCERLHDYLATLDEKNSDRHLCDDIPPITPSPQTTTANSSTPSIVQPSAQNAPSPAPASNNGQDTPSSSAPASAPARPQNVPSPTPASNNGQNSYRQAPSDRNQASNLNSTSVETYINQGLTYHRQRNYQQAISSYSKAIALNPNSAKAYSNRSSAYIGQKDYQKAIADSSKAISLNPTYANAYINRGLAYYHQGNSQQAIANYNKAIELAPNNANAYNYRALAYTRLGNQQAAQKDKRKAAALSRQQPQ